MSLHQRYKSAIRRVAPEPQAEKAACKFNVFSRVGEYAHLFLKIP